MRRSFKRKVNEKFPSTSTKHTIGDKVIGVRSPKAYHGCFVSAHYTLNKNQSGTYRNYGYVIKCDCDGKLRTFQYLVTDTSNISTNIKIQ